MLQKFGAPVLIDCIYEPELNPNDGASAVGTYAVWWRHVCMYVVGGGGGLI